MKVAVVGAGIAGLTCAYELQKMGHEVTVFEKNDHVGGRMSSRVKDGMIFDIGADHLTNNYTEMRGYCEELGVGWERMRFLQYRVFRGGKLYGTKDIMSWWSKLRMFFLWLRTPKGLDYFDLSSAAHLDTENAYDYMKKKAGKEVADYLLDPYCAAYQFHRSSEVSKAALVGSMCSLKYEKEGWNLYRTVGGMKALPNAFSEALLDVRMGTEVQQIQSLKSQNSSLVKVKTAQGEEEFDEVVLACTADVSKKIYQDPSEKQKTLLDAVKYSATVTVCIEVDKDRLPDISTVWVPYVENQVICAYINESYKGEELIKGNKTLISIWLHEDYSRSISGRSDEEIFTAVTAEFLKVCPWFDDIGQIGHFDLQRWDATEPKFYQGYIKQVAEFQKSGQGDQSVWFCGDYMNAPWTEGALRNGKRLAMRVNEEKQ